MSASTRAASSPTPSTSTRTRPFCSTKSRARTSASHTPAARVPLKPLAPDVIRLVVKKFVLQLEAKLADRHVTIEATEDALDWLAKNGFDELYGARPLARVIQEHIKKPLADEILFGKLVRGGHVRVSLKDGELAFEVDGEGALPPAAAGAGEPALAE